MAVYETIVATTGGAIEGFRDGESGTLQWLGVPYARPPVGELRWRAPRGPVAWEGVRETKRFGDDAAQLFGEAFVGSEDCLCLNLWRPDDDSDRLPVLVFAHGGGNLSGSGRDFPGDRLAKATGSIVISVNYRLGAMGFFRHPALRTGDPLDDSGNYGLLDILQALKWVRDNIGRFGGDPDKVTLAGQSAGARNVLAAMISPYGQGLFRQAVVLSGGMTTSSPSAGDERGEAVAAKALGDENANVTADLLRGLDAETLARAVEPGAIRMAPFPHLFEDGAVIPAGGFRAFGPDTELPAPMPVLLGSMATEFSTFAYWDPAFTPGIVDGSLLRDPERTALYEAAVRYGSELYAGFNAERVAEWLTERSHRPPVYAYRFGWGTREGVIADRLRFLLGAHHGADIMFITGHDEGALQEHPEGYVTEENAAGRSALSAAVQAYVRNFLQAGDPNGGDLPSWDEWGAASAAGERRPRLLRLDADADRAIVAMSGEYYRPETALAAMDADPRLAPEHREWLRKHLFDGRFFWTHDR